jgi:hypothetical protein
MPQLCVKQKRRAMISLFETKQEKEIKSHIGRLIRLAKSDGDFHYKEQRMIVKIGREYGLSTTLLEDLMWRTKSYDTTIPEDKETCFYQLLDFVSLIAEDGHITEEEKALYKNLGTELGFKKPILGVLLEKMERDLEKGLDKETILEDCKQLVTY